MNRYKVVRNLHIGVAMMAIVLMGIIVSNDMWLHPLEGWDGKPFYACVAIFALINIGVAIYHHRMIRKYWGVL